MSKYFVLINKILALLVLMIACFGIIINVIHYFEIRRTELVNFNNNQQITKMKQEISNIRKRTNELDLTIYQDKENYADLVDLKNNISTCLNRIEGLPLLNFNEEIKLTVKDKFAILDDVNSSACLNTISNSYEIVARNDKNLSGIDDLMASYLFFDFIALDNMHRDLLNNYNYYTNDYSRRLVSNSIDFDILTIISFTNNQVASLEFISNWLLEETGGAL